MLKRFSNVVVLTTFHAKVSLLHIGCCDVEVFTPALYLEDVITTVY